MRRRTPRTDPLVAVGYLRASTDRQDLSPEAQRAAVEGWALRMGVRVVAWQTDQGVSGAADLEDRPGLVGALADLRAHRAGVLVVARRDRLARSVEVAVAVDRAVRQLGAIVATVDGVGDGDAPADRLVRTILDAAAEHERALIALRTREALRALRARGHRAGAVPWGFSADPAGDLLPNDTERATAERARALRAQGRSLRAIVATLDAEGHRNRSGRPLALQSVQRILASPDAGHRGAP